MELQINKVHYEVTELNELQVHLIHVCRRQFAEIWMQHAPESPTISALINGEAAWLMYLRFEGDAGFSTRNPNYSGPPKAKIEYYLSNGQRDEYPASWNITTNEAMRALEYFFLKEEMAPWLEWHEERPVNHFTKSFGR
jgi:Immunity protein Imm1